jgi:uncharacterized protein YndB with AHSA1/START domain
MSTVTTTDREITFEREFNAPRPLVFKAWTEPERLAHWWGPADWTLPVCKLDLRPGGVWHYCMRGPNGEESWGKATYREIVEPERLAYTDSFSDAAGTVNESMPTMEVSVRFDELDGRTLVTIRALTASAEQAQQLLAMGMVEGFNQSFARLDAHLASST